MNNGKLGPQAAKMRGLRPSKKMESASSVRWSRRERSEGPLHSWLPPLSSLRCSFTSRRQKRKLEEMKKMRMKRSQHGKNANLTNPLEQVWATAMVLGFLNRLSLTRS